ncbi:HET-domain-containing protein, partial [Glonium stellatum]
EFRILKLHPGKFNDPLEASFQRGSLGNTAAYSALSYVWGDTFLKEIIFVSGSTQKIDLALTLNLATILRKIRLEHSSRLIWVDALCINQNDVSERSHQVSMMADIYKNADEVLIWLG